MFLVLFDTEVLCGESEGSFEEGHLLRIHALKADATLAKEPLKVCAFLLFANLISPDLSSLFPDKTKINHLWQIFVGKENVKPSFLAALRMEMNRFLFDDSLKKGSQIKGGSFHVIFALRRLFLPYNR